MAAYCRVSSDSADQLNSYLAQVDFYSKYIAENNGWELADIYADEGISGLDTRNREDFNRMLNDCRAGKIDRVLCKSISRFARNTRDYLQAMRELLRLGVSIQFEKENLDTGKMTSEQVAAIYGAFAQMESTNHASNMRVSVRLHMEKGIYTPSKPPYGYCLKDLELEIIPEEAEIVRYIYAAYLGGQGVDDIAKELNALGVGRGQKGEKWSGNTVRYILTNVSYTGNMIWQKTYAADTLPIQQVKNKGQRPKYYVEDSHPVIISKEDFQHTQELLALRKEQFISKIPRQRYPYSGRIRCGSCGAVFRRKVIRGKVYWTCNRHDNGKEYCSIQPIPESALDAAALRLWNKLTLHGSDTLNPLLDQLRDIRERELRANHKISDIDSEIAHLSEQNLVLARLKSKGYVDSALYLSQMDELDHKLRDLRRLRRKIMELADGGQAIRVTEAMLDYLEDNSQWHGKVTPELFENLVEQITIVSAEQAKFKLLNSLEVVETVERKVR